MKAATTQPPSNNNNNSAMDLLLQMLLYEKDPLLQMSVLDVLEQLATTLPMHLLRAQWLCAPLVLNPLLEMAGAVEDMGGADPILGGPSLRVLACLCRLGQRDTDLFHSAGGHDVLLGFHKALHHFCQGTSGELDRLAAVDAISSFASASPEALELVLDDPIVRDGWLGLAVAQPKLKAVIVTSVAMVIDPAPPSVDANGDAVTTANIPNNAQAMKLFSLLGQLNHGVSSAELVLSLAKSPLPETRLATYSLAKAVAKTSSGAQVLLSQPGFFELLLNRENERTMEGKEGKYAVVQAIMNSPAKGLLADEIVMKLQKVLNEGPHYVAPIRPELMTE